MFNKIIQEYRNKIKHTSEGFPVLLFIKFASKTTKFCGIYNFNLGRHAYFNLGLKGLSAYTKEQTTGPSLVKDYTEVDMTLTGGAYSMEINENSSGEGAF